MTLQLLDTTTGAGDNLKAGGDKINANFREMLGKIVNRKIASRTITGKTQLIALSATGGLYPGQSGSAAGTGVTFDQRIAAPGPFDAIRILIPNVAATAVTGLKVGVAMATASQGFQSTKPAAGGNNGQASAANPNDVLVPINSSLWTAAANAYQWRKAYFGNRTKTEIDLPPAIDASTSIPSYTATDWIPCAPVARSDGGTLPIVAIRLQYPPAGTTPASGASPSSPGVTLSATGFGNWGIDGALDTARPFNGGHFWRAFSDALQGVDNSINFQNSNNPQTMSVSVPIIVQFRMVGEVFTVMYLNDSIGEFTTGEYGASYAFRGALAAANAAGKAMSWCPFTWPSGQIINYARLGETLVDMIQPTILWAKPIGPNETGAPLTQSTTEGAMANLGYVLAIGKRYNSKVIIEPELAINNAGAYQFGAADSFRIAWNTAYAAQAAARDYIFAPLDAPWTAGGTVVSGQQQPLAAHSYDGVHSTEAGHAALTPVATSAASAAISSF